MTYMNSSNNNGTDLRVQTEGSGSLLAVITRATTVQTFVGIPGENQAGPGVQESVRVGAVGAEDALTIPADTVQSRGDTLGGDQAGVENRGQLRNDAGETRSAPCQSTKSPTADSVPATSKEDNHSNKEFDSSKSIITQNLIQGTEAFYVAVEDNFGTEKSGEFFSVPADAVAWTSQGPIAHAEADVDNEGAYRRLDNGGIIFSPAEQDPTADVGVFKAEKGAPEISSPAHDQTELLSPLAFPVPVSENNAHSCMVSVYHKPVVNPILQESNQGSSAEGPVDEVDAEYVFMEGESWEKVQWVGGGATGSCYLAMDRINNSVMVVKQMSVQYNDVLSMRCEVGVMRSIQHENIVQFLGATQGDSHFNIFMEFLPGGSVEAHLKKPGGLGEPLIRSYSRQLLSGVTFLHSKSIAHRDIKCANLLLDSTGEDLRLADFGAAARFSEERKFRKMAGTPPFMAPEVVRCGESKPPYTAKCDVWSMGCAMIEMALGRPPWLEDGGNSNYNRFGILYKIGISKVPPPMPKFESSDLQEMMVQCLQVNEEDRPTSQEIVLHYLLLL